MFEKVLTSEFFEFCFNFGAFLKEKVWFISFLLKFNSFMAIKCKFGAGFVCQILGDVCVG